MKKNTFMLVFFTSMTLSFLGFAQTPKTEASVNFIIKNLGINVDGYFKNASITAKITHQDISQWILQGSVDVTSIDTGNEKRDEHLMREDYFDVENYTQITLQSKNFKKVAENKYTVTVDLTIKKTTKTVQIPVEIISDASRLELHSNFEINRRDYDVGGSSWILSNKVKISVQYTVKN